MIPFLPMYPLFLPIFKSFQQQHASSWQQAHCNFSKNPVSIVETIIIGHHQITAGPEGNLRPWLCPHSLAQMASVHLSAKAVVVTHRHLWPRSQTVKGFLVDVHAVLRQASLTGRHLNHKFLINTADVNMKDVTVLRERLEGRPVMILTGSALNPEMSYRMMHIEKEDVSTKSFTAGRFQQISIHQRN